MHELALAGTAREHLRVLPGRALDDDLLDPAYAGQVAGERGPLDHHLEPLETIGDLAGIDVHLCHLSGTRARPRREDERVGTVVRGL